MKKTLSIMSVMMALLFCQIFLTGFGSDKTPQDSGVSPCKITRDIVDQSVSVFGRIVFITHDDPEGIFAELEAEGCIVGVFNLFAGMGTVG